MSFRAQALRLLRAFMALNRRVCDRIEPLLPQRVDLFTAYEAQVRQRMDLKASLVVLDVGGGKECPFAKYRSAGQQITILGLDVSPDELIANRDVDGKIVASVTEGLPLRSDTVDAITSRSVLEHIGNMELFVKESSRVLKNEGWFIHEFTSKFAPFALINQMLPRHVSKRLIDFLIPEKVGNCGFPAVYNRCYYSEFKRLLRANRLELVHATFSYYQSRYWDFFAPCS